jgi:hypothetical protein
MHHKSYTLLFPSNGEWRVTGVADVSTVIKKVQLLLKLSELN